MQGFAWVKLWVKVPFRKVPNYIVKARSSYQLQRGVPADVQTQVGKKKWKEPGGKTLNEARAKVPGFIARTDAAIKKARCLHTTSEEELIHLGDVPGYGPLELAEMAAPHLSMYLEDGMPNPQFEALVGLAEAIKGGTATAALLSPEGLLQARRLDREPSPRTFQGWVKALEAFMAFTSKPKPYQCIRADAVAYKDALLTVWVGALPRRSSPTWLDCGRRL